MVRPWFGALKQAIVDILQRANGGAAGAAPLTLCDVSPSCILVVGKEAHRGSQTTDAFAVVVVSSHFGFFFCLHQSQN